ncbi:MAG: hypothetical protein M0P39_06575 [Rhodocyclaceae bacterium]|nr:hypothetical protein [Rhodocyclaceae bacterium]
MKLYVVDSSVALKWFLCDDPDESDVDQALGLLQGALNEDCRFLQPPHWIAEVVCVVARKRPLDAALALTNLLEMTCHETIQTAHAYARAVDLSLQLDHHLFTYPRLFDLFNSLSSRTVGSR